MTLEELRIVISASTEPLRREMGQVRRQLGELQNETNRTTSGIHGAFKKLVGGIIALKIGQKIGQAITSGIREAMNVEASLQQIKRIMGESTNQFLKWANTQAIAFNMSKGEAIKYGSVFGNLLMTFTKSSSETMKYTEDLLKASSIIASATGRSMTDVMERIRSGLLGNTEAIEDLGVNVNVAMIQSTDAFKKFAGDKSWNQLDFQTQQQIRLMAILEQTNKKYGDTVNQNTSSQLQQLVANLNNVKLSLGQAFLPIVRIVLPVLTALAQQLSYVMGIVAQFSEALFGKSIQTGNKQAQNTQAQAKAMTGLGNATEKAGKQAKGALAGFDEINSLADSNSDSSDNSNAIDAANIGMDAGSTPLNFDTNAPEVSSKIQDMANRIKTQVKEVTDIISANKEIIISAVGGIIGAFAAFETLTFLSTVPEIIIGIGAALATLLTPIGIASLVIGGLIASFIYLYQTNEDFRIKINSVWSEISKTLNGFVNDTLKPIFNYIVNDFLSPIGKAFKDYILPVLAELFVGIGNILNDILKLLKSTLDNAWGIVKPGLDLIKTIVIDVLEIIKMLWDKYGNDLIKNARDFIQGLQDTFQLIWDNILNPIIKPFLEMLTWLWTEHLSGLVTQIGEFIMKCVNGALELYNGFIKPIIDWLIVELGPSISNTVTFIVDVFGTMIATISDVISGLFKILGGLIDFIVGVFTGNWKKAWQGVKDVFGGVWDMIAGVLKGSVNIIIDLINSMLRNAVNGLNNFIQGAVSLANKLPGVNIQVDYIQAPQIPKLAKGGITNGPMLAMVGDNPGGKEVVSPLDKLRDMIASAVGTAMMAANQFNSNTNQDINLNLYIDGTTFARATYSYNQKEANRIGNPMIVTT